MGKFTDWLQHTWSIFSLKEPNTTPVYGSSSRPDRSYIRRTTEASIVNSIYNRIAVDVSLVDIEHVRTDENGKYLETINSNLNSCLTLSANLDQSGRELIRDIVQSLCDEGVVAVVPVETKVPIHNPGIIDILQMRTAKIVQWYPDSVKVELYNQKTGQKQQIIINKRFVAIIENPFYSMMNEPNSFLRRLINKLSLLDIVDDISGSGKLDLLIQIPYSINSERKKEQSFIRRQEIESQLKDGKYGIAYIDGTEKVIQLNRASENNLLGQVQYLTSMLYNQLGITEDVFYGRASSEQMLNYYNRTIEPFLTAITDAMNIKFLTKTARSQHQAIMFFKDPFKIIPTDRVAEISDTLVRNEILTKNEVRAILGYKAVKSDPNADKLSNPNMPIDKKMNNDIPFEEGGN